MTQAQYFELRQAEAQPTPTHTTTCRKRLRHVSKIPKRWRCFALWTTRTLLGLAGASLLLMLAYSLAVIIISPRPNEQHLSLYKNTRFEPCMATPSSHFNCSELTRGSLDPLVAGATLVRWLEVPGKFVNGVHIDWCDVAGCFKEWQVVPSTPRDSAFGLTSFSIWAYLMVTAAIILWDLKETLSHPDKCTGPSLLSWSALIYNIITLGLWIAGFVPLLGDVSFATPVSLVGWIAICNLSIGLHYHPWPCWSVLRRRPRIKKVLTWILNILVLVQWIATVYALRVYWDFYHYGAYLTGEAIEKHNVRKYDCIEAQVSAAPDISSCSAQTLCSQPGFYTAPDFYVNPRMRRVLDAYTVLALIAIVCCPLCVAAIAILRVLHQSAPRLIDKPVRKGWLPKEKHIVESVVSAQLYMTTLFVLVGLAIGGFLLLDKGISWDFGKLAGGGEGTITWNPSCKAVHVGLSPEWAFLDIEKNRFVRTARIFFNV